MHHGLILIACITVLSALSQHGLRYFLLGASTQTYLPHECPLKLQTQQGLSSSTCLQRLVLNVHVCTLLSERAGLDKTSLCSALFTYIGNPQNDNLPEEVLLPPGPGPGCNALGCHKHPAAYALMVQQESKVLTLIVGKSPFVHDIRITNTVDRKCILGWNMRNPLTCGAYSCCPKTP